MKVVFTRLSFDDVVEASAWYSSQQAGLGEEFEAAVDLTIKDVSIRSTSFPVVGLELRRASLSRFPYAVFFRAEIDRIVVVGVIHGSRDPKIWKARA